MSQKTAASKALWSTDWLYYIPAAVPSAVAALEMAQEIRNNYEYGGSYLAPVVGIFLSVLFVMVGKSVGVGFANSLASRDHALTGLFLFGLVGYGAGEWWVNPLAAGKVASVFVVAFYIAVPLSRIVEARASEAAMVRRAQKKAEAATYRVEEAKRQLEVKQLQQAKKEVGKMPRSVSETVFPDVSERFGNTETGEETAVRLTPAEIDVLTAVLGGLTIQADIAKETGRARSTVSKVVKKLEPMGVIHINGNGIEPTDLGRGLID